MASRLRETRINLLKATQDELAQASDVTVKTISRAENGESIGDLSKSKIHGGVNVLATAKGIPRIDQDELF